MLEVVDEGADQELLRGVAHESCYDSFDFWAQVEDDIAPGKGEHMPESAPSPVQVDLVVAQESALVPSGCSLDLRCCKVPLHPTLPGIASGLELLPQVTLNNPIQGADGDKEGEQLSLLADLQLIFTLNLGFLLHDAISLQEPLSSLAEFDEVHLSLSL